MPKQVLGEGEAPEGFSSSRMAISNAIVSSATCWLTRCAMNLETAMQIGLSLRLNARLNCAHAGAHTLRLWDSPLQQVEE